jgi:hypothetical protein
MPGGGRIRGCVGTEPCQWCGTDSCGDGRGFAGRKRGKRARLRPQVGRTVKRGTVRVLSVNPHQLSPIYPDIKSGKCLLLLRGVGGCDGRPWAHNPKVAGSNPAPATKEIKGLGECLTPFFVGWVAYSLTADNISSPLLTSLRGVDQPGISTPNVLSVLHSTLLARSCAHAAQGGFCVRPAKGLGSLEGLRLPGGGTGTAGGWGDSTPRLGQR